MDEFQSGQEALAARNYTAAVEFFSKAISQDCAKDEFFVARAISYNHLERYADALADANEAILINKGNRQAYFQKGISLYHKEAYSRAKEAFHEAITYEGLKDECTLWLTKCEAKLNLPCDGDKTNVSQLTSPTEETKTEDPIAPAIPTEGASAPVITATPTPLMPKTRYDWYQTEGQVIITILLKNIKNEDFHYEVEPFSLSVNIRLPSGSDYTLDLDLSHEVVPDQCSYKLMATKVEIKLKKRDALQWTKLEGEPNAPQLQHFKPAPAVVSTHNYPSSSQHTRDWDKVVADIKKEEETEQPEGEAALQALFQKIYGDGSDEVKKAMNKSFVESGGTVLSTNWKDVGNKPVEVKAPDGMEFKKYEF